MHYLKKPDADIDPTLLPKGEKVLSLMESELETRRYFVGEKLSLADIALVAYTRFSREAGFDLAHWPKVFAWVRRIEQDLGIEEAR